MTATRISLIATAAALAAPAAYAACDPGKPGSEMSYEEAQTVYECIAEDLHAGYVSGPKGWIPKETVENYRDWTKASTMPANPGFHSNRFLVTWVNDAGRDAYLEYDDEAAEMPTGTLLAKESFNVNDAGKVVKGPLFFMEKVGEDVSPESGGWYYYMVSASGAPQAVNVMQACVACHMDNFGFRDSVGLPVPDVRVSN